MKNVDLKFYIALAALLVSIIFNVTQCIQSENQIAENRQQKLELDSIQYIGNGLSFRPRLELIGEPKIVSQKIFYNKSEVLNPFFKPDSVINDSTMLIKAKLKFMVRFRFENKGNSIAKILIESIRDTFSPAPILRKNFLEAIETNSIKTGFIKDYSKINVGAGDSLDIEMEITPAYLKDDEMNTHFIVYYENEFGHLYDTYVWSIFDNIPITFKRRLEYHNKTGQILGIIEQEQKQDQYRCKTLNQEFKFHDKKTANTILKYLDKANELENQKEDSLKSKV